MRQKFNSIFMFCIIPTMIYGLFTVQPVLGDNTVYYVSITDGDDGNDGLSPSTPFQTISKVNIMNLLPGDKVLFKCGDTWQGEMLIITDSGSSTNPIVFGSYPKNCSNKPVISGSLPILDWAYYSGNIYRADLASPGNRGRFPNGINQLFRNNNRLLLGRWPNLGSTPDGGYSTIDSHIPSSAQITDLELPSGDWSGAVVHVKGIRWYILNRKVISSSSTTLTLNDTIFCYTGNCAGWGYFINNHLNTLDQEGEWYFDQATNTVYLYTSTGLPYDGELEGSAIITGDGNYLGGIIIGRNLYEHVTDLIIENFHVQNWFDSGLTFPINFELDDPARIIIRENLITDVENTGIRLSTWVWNAGPDSGWRGGENLIVENNVIDGANHFGIDVYSCSSLFTGNIIRNIGLIKNLGKSGMGCGFTGINCTENGDGFRLKLDNPAFSGYGNIIKNNTFERIGMQGIDVFGPNNILENNVIGEACFSKGDCGAIRTFGRTSFAESQATKITITGNIITDTIGNTDGNHADFDSLFGFGLYIDNYSDSIIVSRNTILNSTAAGILVQNSRADLSFNTVRNNGSGTASYAQVTILGSAGEVSITDCIMYGITPTQKTLRVQNLFNLTISDRNYLFNPYNDFNITVDVDWTPRNLAQWQSYSGMDLDSVTPWFTLLPSEPPLSKIFVNSTNTLELVMLGPQHYLDMDQNPVFGKMLVQPYSSRILVLDTNGYYPVPGINNMILVILLIFLSVLLKVSLIISRKFL